MRQRQARALTSLQGHGVDGVIVFPHVHLANSQPQPFFERGGQIVHGRSYQQRFEMVGVTPELPATWTFRGEGGEAVLRPADDFVDRVMGEVARHERRLLQAFASIEMDVGGQPVADAIRRIEDPDPLSPRPHRSRTDPRVIPDRQQRGVGA